MRTLPLLAAIACLVGLTAASDYDYPIQDPFAATVLGTPEAQLAKVDPLFELETDRLDNLFEREVPDAFWYAGELAYGYALQEGKAPLAFIISGTGGDHIEAGTKYLAGLLFGLGAHVVTLPSPTHPNFMVAASRYVLPGDPASDTDDLARVMKVIMEQITQTREIGGIWLTGYSLGALQAGFLAERDSREKAFGYKKVLLINPPISLYQSALRLDGYLEAGVAEGFENIDAFFDELMRDLAAIYERADLVQLDGDFLFDIYKRKKIDPGRIKALIGLAFRLTAANLLFTSDAFNHTNYVVPDNIDLGYNTSLTEYFKVAVRLSFEDYINDLFIPGLQERDPGLSAEAIIASASLEAISGYLRTSSHIGLIHNRDDVILGPGDIGRFEELFGDRATIYPTGGHLGNLFHQSVAASITAFFSAGTGS